MSNHGYRYAIGDTVWEGDGFFSRKEAEDSFQKLTDEWINEHLPAPKRWWQFWKDDVELPSIERHVF